VRERAIVCARVCVRARLRACAHCACACVRVCERVREHASVWGLWARASVCVRARVCVRSRVRACVRACVRTCVSTNRQQGEARSIKLLSNAAHTVVARTFYVYNLFLHTKDAVTAFHDDPLLEESLKPALLEKRFKRHRVSVLLLVDLDILRPLLGVLLPMMFLDVVNAELRPVLGVLCPTTFPRSNVLLSRERHRSYVCLVETQCVCAA